MGIMSGTRVITTAKSKETTKESRIDLILPLKTKAPAGRKVFFWEITDNALAVIHTSPNAVFRSRNKGRRSCTVTRAEVGIDVIPRLSFRGVFIARVGY